MKTTELFGKKTVFSLEIFPPRADMGENVIYETLDALHDVNADFISVTYGRNSGQDGCRTVKIASDIKHKYGVESIAHLPCSGVSKDTMIRILDALKENEIDNILALRGDLPDGEAVNGDFLHADELISFIKSRYDFNILAACYPECHPEATSYDDDIEHLKRKVDCGADHLITQLFLDNTHFYRFMYKANRKGINVPVEAGIMPVTNKRQIERMVKMCGVELPGKFMKILDKYGDNEKALKDAGIAYAVDQITDLMANDVDGIHLYTMNDPYVAHKIYEAVCNLI